MSKIDLMNQIDTLIADEMTFCQLEILFYLDSKILALDKQSRELIEMSLPEAEDFLKEYSKMRIIAFNYNFSWDVTHDFDHSGFIMPDILKRPSCTILLCHDPARAKGFIALTQKKNSPDGFN